MTEKAWQLGYSLRYLESLAAPFKDMLEPHCYGAFGRPKERDIAIALQKKRLTYIETNKSGLISSGVDAVALFQRYKQTSTQVDFTGAKIGFRPGDILIKSIAWLRSDEAAERLVDHLYNGLESDGALLWLEIHQESKPLRQLAKRKGFEWIATKVSAGSEIKSLWAIGRERDSPKRLERRAEPIESANDVGLACLEESYLPKTELRAIREELRVYGDQFAQHYSSYNKRNSWRAFALRGYDDDPSFIVKPSEMSKQWKADNAGRLGARPRNTSALEGFPTVDRLLDRLISEILSPLSNEQRPVVASEKNNHFDRVRFMRLDAGGELSRHADIVDRDAGVADNKIARLHIPIETSDAVRFWSWDGYGVEHSASMSIGSLWYLDQRKPHRAVNQSDADRIHLVVDLRSTEGLRSRIRYHAKSTIALRRKGLI